MPVSVTYNGETLDPEPRLYGSPVAQIATTIPMRGGSAGYRRVVPTQRVITITLAETPDPVPDGIKRGRPIRLHMTTLAEPHDIVGIVRYRRLRKIVIDGHIEKA